MVNKKGWLRVVEASAAVLLVVSVIFIVGQSKKIQINQDIGELIGPVLDEIAKNPDLRDSIIQNGISSASAINTYLSGKFPSYLNYAVQICVIGGTNDCSSVNIPSEQEEKSVYVDERIIAASLKQSDTADMKKVRIYLWAK